FQLFDIHETKTKEKGIIFKDEYNNLLTLIYDCGIVAYNLNNKKLEALLILDINQNSPEYINTYRLLDVKGEWLLVLGIYHNNVYNEFEYIHNHFRIYKYNIQTKQVRIWDSRDHGLTMFIYDYYNNYDISRDRRYIYMSFQYGYNGYDSQDTVSYGGVYVFDWWEEKLYKIYQPMSDREFDEISEKHTRPNKDNFYEIDVKVVNNTDDGYVYALWEKIEVTDEKFKNCYRFKNPEPILNNFENHH
ncbi:MAG: hypothetical protein ACOC7U_10845, partial [Spirochaetota bacterium]